ncbi:glycogen debranching protein GlgX [Thiorhodococcus mannitoliphagus]|uniref:Glycogen debranching protein GlgX n=1 Tax=Thiorhodococcus mannitoliphagus TaxID=329406 RepID=A0A6P1DVI9_9GAMM|nr:glycogen debranching protein GlgX [Thiorhodococcus mannitoliphagus]NEX22138.1 glycogen debranching protein GlgX [Thiorhodococcus mannitoliphagus]
MRPLRYRVRPGNWDFAGATVMEGGVNFCVFSRYAEKMQLMLFEGEDSPDAYEVIQLDPRTNRTFFFWHIFVEGLPHGTLYNWRADGHADTRETGSRLDRDKALLDPWATTISTRLWDREAACRPGDNVNTAMRGQVVSDDYDWEGDAPLHIPLNEAVIYELHVGGFTRHPSSGVAHPGTYEGIIEKIPYLQDLGITHVELMPVMAFDPKDVPPKTAKMGLENYWGYSTHSFFAPHPGFAIRAAHARDEFRDMVKAFHKAGIGIILDVVFNHTAEGGEEGPVISFKAFGNEVFYHLDFDDRRRYRDYTGCGNTMNCNHPMVTRFLIDAILYWVQHMHVDGFRFDLASALARGEDGNPQYHAPVLWAIELSPSLSRAHIIAEAWDAAGLYQVGDFPGYRWAEWNGRYRDVIRAFVRGDPGLVAEVATRIAGSSDLYEPRGRLPVSSINFVTCHDGFTLCDLVSYNHKHNLANGEDNRDGHDHNLSWNCGSEGPTDDPGIQALRRRQARNFISILMLSQGVPMLLAGDEVFRSKQGNNNTYCQNNELSWSDWDLVEKNKDMLEFMRAMIALRRRHPSLMRDRFLTGKPERGQALADITWHGVGLEQPQWDDPASHALAFTLAAKGEDEPPMHVMLNMGMHSLEFAVPTLQGLRWCLAVDTSGEKSVIEPQVQEPIALGRVKVDSHAVVVLEARPR